MTEIEEMAKELAGNWQKFESFSWGTACELKDPEKWGIVYLEGRDSEILEQSNAVAIRARMEKFMEKDVLDERHRHWLCGHVDALVVRVFDDKNEITDAFRELHEINKALEDYPVLDEDDYCRREYEDALDRIDWNMPNPEELEIPDLGDKTAAQVLFTWFWDNMNQIDCRDRYPTQEEYIAAYKDLGWWKEVPECT